MVYWILISLLASGGTRLGHAAETRQHLISEQTNRREPGTKSPPRPRVPEWLAADAESRKASAVPPKASCPVQSYRTSFVGLSTPHGIALGKDFIYVANTRGSRVVKYTLDGKLIGAWDLKTQSGESQTARGIAVDSKGNVYVPVERERAIIKYSPAGKLLKRWSAYDGKKPYPSGQHDGPWDLAISENDEIYAVDPNIGQVDVYDTEGKKLRALASVPPWSVGLTVGPGKSPTTYVADTSNGRILKISPDGRKIESFTDTKMDRPYDVALDENGDVYATDYSEHAIYRFSPAGSLVARIRLPETSAGGLSNPRHFVIRGCTLYIADGGNNRIAVLGPTGHG